MKLVEIAENTHINPEFIVSVIATEEHTIFIVPAAGPPIQFTTTEHEGSALAVFLHKLNSSDS